MEHGLHLRAVKQYGRSHVQFAVISDIPVTPELLQSATLLVSVFAGRWSPPMKEATLKSHLWSKLARSTHRVEGGRIPAGLQQA